MDSRILTRLQTMRTGTAMTSGELNQSSLIEYEQRVADKFNAQVGTLDGVDCPVCLNKGSIMIIDANGYRRMRDCKCMEQRKSIHLMQTSGLSKALENYTWESWQETEPWQKAFKKKAQEYADSPRGWFLATGRPGTGKTHMCTAICGELLMRGMGVRYAIWREFATKAKALVTDSEGYEDFINDYKWVKVLYLDDLFKVKQGERPTAADVNLAFELLNARYADPDKLTIISTELSVPKLLDIDEATGSRIYERAKENYIDLSTRENWRLK